MVKDGVNGILVPPGDSKKLAEAAIKLCEDQDFYESCSRNALEFVSKDFKRNRAVDIMRVYSELIDKKTGASWNSRPIKVMHILLSLAYGGAEKVVINLIKKMRGNEFKFSVCVLDRVGALKDEVNGDIKIECMNRQRGLDFALPVRLSRAIRRISPDIIHMHNPSTLLYGAIAGKLAGTTRMIVTQHGSVSVEGRKMQMATKRLSRLLDKNVAVSSSIAKYLGNHYGLGNDKIETIINGIDETVYKPDAAKRQAGRLKFNLEDKIVIGHIARLASEKDQNNLLEAFSKVAGIIGKARLVIVGDGPLRKELEGSAKRLNISDKVIFTGFQEDIPFFLNIFDIFVLSSMREGTSLTLIEAMAVELPVIATNAGGSPDVVIDRKTGLLVPPKNSDKLAEAIIRLCENPGAREEMGKAGRLRMEENFSLSGMADKYAGLYREIVNR